MNQENHFEIVLRDPIDLRPLPEVASMPRWNADTPEFHGLCDDIQENGIKTPLRITADNRVVDGETRRLAAKSLNLPQVPCVVVPDDEINEIILRELLRRRHLSKGTLAFLAVPMLEPAFEEAKARRAKNLQNPNKLPKCIQYNSGLKEYAVLLGFSYETLNQARQIHDFFARFPKPELYGDAKTPITLEDYIRPQILNAEEPLSLGGALKAIGYLVEAVKHPQKKTGGKPKNTEKQFALFNDTITDELNRWEYWQKFDAETKAEHFKLVQTKAETLPAEQLEQLAEYHAKLAAEFRRAAKKQQTN